MNLTEVADRLKDLLPDHLGFEMTHVDDDEIQAQVTQTQMVLER